MFALAIFFVFSTIFTVLLFRCIELRFALMSNVRFFFKVIMKNNKTKGLRIFVHNFL